MAPVGSSTTIRQMEHKNVEHEPQGKPSRGRHEDQVHV